MAWPAFPPPAAEKLDRDVAMLPAAEVAGYLQDRLGQRVAAHLVGLRGIKQIGRYRREDGPEPNQRTELRLREGCKVVRTIVEAFDEKTAKAWLFGTNTRLDDEAPVDVLRAAVEPPLPLRGVARPGPRGPGR